MKIHNWFCVAATALTLAGTAIADDGSAVVYFGDWNTQEAIHLDGDPWKGNFTLTAYNNSLNSWGDFHFAINGAGSDATKVFFFASPLTSSQELSGPAVVGVNNLGMSTLDLQFYADPVAPGEVATFTVYTDNTAAMNAWFGVCFWPTPVPEPGTFSLLLGAGLLAGWMRRKAA